MRLYRLGETPGIDAWQLGQADDVPLAASEVRVRTRACSLNYRDLLIATAKYGGRLPTGLVPVSDAAGEVIEVGSEVKGMQIGDKVIGCFFDRWLDGPLTPAKAKTARGGAIGGVLAEHFVSHVDGLVPMPDSLSFEEAATLPCAALTAWNSMFEAARLVPGQSVLIQGTGGVSVFAIQFAKLAGIRSLVTSSSNAKLARARSLGADETLNYVEHPDWDKWANQVTGGEGVDAVLEVGGAGTLSRSLKAARYGGHISIIGVLAGAAAELSIGHVQAKNLVLQGIYVGSKAMFGRMNRSLPTPAIDRVFTFDQAPAALEALGRGEHFGKIVITV